MNSYSVYGRVFASKFIGTFNAKNSKEAIELAETSDANYVSICHQCSESFELNEHFCTDLVAELIIGIEPKTEPVSIPERNSKWSHTNGSTYTVLMIANEKSERLDYPPTVVYQGCQGLIWSRPLSDWYRSMTLIPPTKTEFVWILAGNYSEARKYVTANRVPTEFCQYVANSSDFQGRRGDTVWAIGSYEARSDILEILELIKIYECKLEIK